MIIKFEKLEGYPNLRVIDPTWRGDNTDLLVHADLSRAIEKLWGDEIKPGSVVAFEISAIPINGLSEMFTIEGKPKMQLGGAMYTNKTVGLQFICELLLMYVGPAYPENFYLRKHE